jgi:hypothetical protein
VSVTTGAVSAARASFVIVEDGHEYTERFTRFLGGSFTFVRAGDGLEAAALASCAGAGAPAPPAGLLLDLDFRRTPVDRLLDAGGERPRSPAEAAALAPVQGILILRHLRAKGVVTPALLFADLDDRAQSAALEQSLAPLAIVPSSEGLPALAARLREMATR